MVTAKKGSNIESSEIGLAGEIIQSCTAIATRLLEKVRSFTGQIRDAEANGQPPEASLSHKKNKLNKDGKDSIDRQRIGGGEVNRVHPEGGSDIVPDIRTDIPAELPPRKVEPIDISSFEDVVGQLRLWADGLNVSEGQLDKALEHGGTMKPALYAIFVEITTLLTRASRDILHDNESVLGLQVLTEKALLVSSKDLLDAIAFDDEDRNLKETLDFQTLIEDFADLSQDLLQLTPSLMDLQESYNLPELEAEIKPATSQSAMQPELPHDHFKRKILDHFTDAQPGLVERLAKACWNLYISIKDGHIKREKAMEALAAEDKDSAYESMLQSEMAPSLIGKLRDEASDTTSLAADSVQLKDRPKIPLPPVDLGPNVDFVCNICSRLQKGISNTTSWRKHVIADIQPYICSFDECHQPAIRFASRSAWMHHEYAAHRQRLEWRCIYRNCLADVKTFLSEDEFLFHMAHSHNFSHPENSELLLVARTCRRLVATITDANIDCPLCLRSIPNRKSKIGRHLGRHMEDIAMPILSLVLPPTEDVDGSEDSDVQTISEYDEPHLMPLASDDPPSQRPYGGEPTINASRTRPSTGDSVLISYLNPNRPDIAQEVGARALRSASRSESDEEDNGKRNEQERNDAEEKQESQGKIWVEGEQLPIKFKDAIGRKFNFPFHLCSKWHGMEELIRQAFVQVRNIGPLVLEGHYDLLGPDGKIILPTVWDRMVEPGWRVSMHMWPESLNKPDEQREKIFPELPEWSGYKGE